MEDNSSDSQSDAANMMDQLDRASVILTDTNGYFRISSRMFKYLLGTHVLGSPTISLAEDVGAEANGDSTGGQGPII